jgi:hypothetical protein
MFIRELECFDDSQALFDRSTNWEIVNVGCSKGTFGVDEE